MIGIYKITSPSKKIYIGQSVNIQKRFTAYRLLDCKQQSKLYNSLKKYGFHKHLFEVIVQCDVFDLNDLERHYQDLYSATNNKGLNLFLTSSSDRNGYHSKESIDKMIIARSKRKQSSYDKYSLTRKGYKMPQKLKGFKLSEETKLKMSISRSGSGNSKSKKVLCTVTNKIYDSVAICERENNIKFNSLCNKLNGNRTNNTNFIYL